MIPQREALLEAGRVFLRRWTDWIEANPDADEALVREAMANGEPPPKAARGNGRPTKLTPETHTIIISAIRAGAYYEDAANMAGVSYDTLNNWKLRGAAEAERRANSKVREGTAVWKSEQPFFEFFEACKKAEGNAVVGWLNKIDQASDEHWQAAAWKAERRYPERYGRQRVEWTGANGQPIQTAARVEFGSISDDDLYDAFVGAMGQIAATSAGEGGSYGPGVGYTGAADGADAAAAGEGAGSAE